MEEEKVRNRYNELDDMLSTTGAAMLGLTLGCARCHDHKYDNISTRDYYRLLSAFNSGNRAEVPLAPPEEIQQHRQSQSAWQKELDSAIQNLERYTNTVRKPHEQQLRNARIDQLNLPDDKKELLKNEPASKEGKKLAMSLEKELRIEEKEIVAVLTQAQQQEGSNLVRRLEEVKGRKPRPLPTALAFADYASTPRTNWLLGRGDLHLRKEIVPLGFLTALTKEKSAEDYWAAARASQVRDDSTQQRRALANWVTDIDQGAGALAARVVVNRVWQHHFGAGLVRTVNDFGVQAEAPSHPELLEWLAHELVRSGWKLKHLHRLMLTSAVYLQDSKFTAEQAMLDPENRLWWRQRPARLEAEILRDTFLEVSGTLNGRMFGPAFKPPIAREAIQARNLKDPYPADVKDGPSTRRRSIYMFHKRVVQYPLMQAFDGPDATTSCGRRNSTTVAPQALALLNDRFIRACAEDFARRLKSEKQTEEKVRRAWWLALSRPPTAAELEAGVNFIGRQSAKRQDRLSRPGGTDPAESSPGASATELAVADFCQAIFALNEFMYVD